MDPISAISVAAAVVDFVDFGSGLLRETAEIYRSSTGQSGVKLDISSVSRDLTVLSDEVNSKSKLIMFPPGRGSEEVFARLCGDCKDIGTELQECVADTRDHASSNTKRAFDSFLVALQQTWSKEKIEALRLRLDRLQQRMMIAVLVFLW
jgi:hypothetical protein